MRCGASILTILIISILLMFTGVGIPNIVIMGAAIAMYVCAQNDLNLKGAIVAGEVVKWTAIVLLVGYTFFLIYFAIIASQVDVVITTVDDPVPKKNPLSDVWIPLFIALGIIWIFQILFIYLSHQSVRCLRSVVFPELTTISPPVK